MLRLRAPANETALMELLIAIEDTLQKVMLIGHNPGLAVLTNTIGDSALNNFGEIDVSPVLTHGRRTTRYKQ